MDHSDHDTDHQDMTAMVLGGHCVATALSVCVAGPSTKMVTISSPAQTCPNDSSSCDSSKCMDLSSTGVSSGHIGSQSSPPSQGVGTNTHTSASLGQLDLTAGHVDVPNGLGDSMDISIQSHPVSKGGVGINTNTSPPGHQPTKVDIPSGIGDNAHTYSPPKELEQHTKYANIRSRLEAKADILPTTLDLYRELSSTADIPSADSDVITSDDGEHLKDTPAEPRDETSTGHVTGENRTKACDSPTENTRSLRRCRKRVLLDGDSRCCPICGTCVRQGELSSHLMVEVEKLGRLTRCGRKMSQDGLTSSHGKKSRTVTCRPDTPSTDDSSKCRYETFQRIQSERQSRMAARHKKASETRCPVCNKCIVGSPGELILHVDQCLMNKGQPEEDCIVDIDGEEEEAAEYEEYTWAGQTRVRVTTMLEGGLAASGFKCVRKDVDEDEDLNVDEDESEMFGRPQYSEGDLIPCCSDEPAEERARKALRKAVLRNENGLTSASRESGSAGVSDSPPQRESNTCSTAASTTSASCQVDPSEVIASLKARIQQDVVQLAKSNVPRCLICMEMYTRPLTSIQCWHVHCEDCWLRTLGAKKLCPQCNMITSPADLRRIYL